MGEVKAGLSRTPRAEVKFPQSFFPSSILQRINKGLDYKWFEEEGSAEKEKQ